MKIMMVTPYFYPKMGGMENYAYNIAKGLRKDYGWEVVVVTSNHVERKRVIERIDGIKIYRLPRWFKVSNTPINPIWYFQIKKIIKEEKPDIINAHTPVPYISDISARACGETPFVLTYHAASLYKYKNLTLNIFIFIYKFLIEGVALNKAVKILMVSEFIKYKLPVNLRYKTVTIPNSISIDNISPKIIIKKKKNIILFIANLDKTHSWKGLGNIIMAIDWYIKNLDNSIELIVVGVGDYKSYYEELVKSLNISEYVRFVGAKYGKQKYNLISKSKILVTYPESSNDAFPTVFLEAWANLTPIISSDISPISNILNDRRNGYLVKTESPTALAEGIFKLIIDDELRLKLIINGWSEVKKYTWEKQVKRTNDLFTNLI